MPGQGEVTFAKTKIQPPRLRSDLITRPALDSALAKALADRRLTLILAPAGWGKTSALARQLQRLPVDTALAWVSADADDDVPRFVAGLTAALEPLDLPWRVAPAALATLLQGERGVRALADEIVNALAECEAPRALLAIDDLHRWTDSRLTELLASVIEQLPSRWGIVLSSRSEPLLPLARWRASGEVTEFRQAELRFGTQEIKTLLLARGLSSQAAEELHKRTEGWAVGLRLLLEVGAGFDQGRAQSQRHIFDFLADEVFIKMPADMQLFLLRCSILPELSAPRCAHVSGMDNAPVLFERVQREGLFVTPLDDRADLLRLHDLFRDFLEQRLRRERASELPSLWQRAADHEPDLSRAVQWLVNAGALERAAELIEKCGQGAMPAGGWPAIKRLLQAFPQEFVRASPHLSFVNGQCAFFQFEFDELVSSMASAMTGFAAAGKREQAAAARVYWICGLQNTGRFDEARAAIDQLRALQPTGPLGVIVAYFSAWQAFAEIREDQVVSAIRDMIAHLEHVPMHPIWGELVMMTSCVMLRGGAPIMQRFDDLAWPLAAHRAENLRVSLQHLRAVRAFAQGRLTDASNWLAGADEDLEWMGRPTSQQHENFSLHLLVDSTSGNSAMAQELARRIPEYLQHTSLANLRAHGCQVLTPVLMAQWVLGDGDGVRRTRAALARNRNASEWRVAEGIQALADGMAALLDSDDNRAEARLALAAQTIARTTYGTGVLALVLCAEAQRRQGRLDDAARSLERLFAEPDLGFLVGAALLAGAPTLDALASAPWGSRLTAAQREQLGTWRAIACHEPPSTERTIGAGDAQTPAGLTHRETEVLELIAEGKANKSIARDLGLSLFTVKRHVANILGKTARTSRTELATWWLGQRHAGARA
jgi:LuxR family transcriptional regulator, maltose regulon positive regulatory protein